jgi:hypothetical protein
MPRIAINAAGVFRIGGLKNAEGAVTLYVGGTVGTGVVTARALPVGTAAPATGTGPLVRAKDLAAAAETYVSGGPLTFGKLWKVDDAGGLDIFLDVTGAPGSDAYVDFFTTE